jgi:hypothetical protein
VNRAARRAAGNREPVGLDVVVWTDEVVIVRQPERRPDVPALRVHVERDLTQAEIVAGLRAAADLVERG